MVQDKHQTGKVIFRQRRIRETFQNFATTPSILHGNEHGKNYQSHRFNSPMDILITVLLRRLKMEKMT